MNKKSILTLLCSLTMLLCLFACDKKDSPPPGDHGKSPRATPETGQKDGQKEGQKEKEGKKEYKEGRSKGQRGDRREGRGRPPHGNAGAGSGPGLENLDIDNLDLDKVDVDKLPIPDRIKQAVKSGRIPKERLKDILKRIKGMSAAPLVEVQPVQRQKLNAFLVLNGVVEPERKVDVYSRLSAFVKKIVKEEGDIVKEGDTIALLDDTEVSIQYRQAKILLQQAELTLEDETANLKRSKRLKETDMISEQDLQLAQANFDKARLDHKTRQENFKDLELQLSYTKIKAPVPGYITQRLIEVGSRVNTNQQVYTVEDFSPLLVKVYVPSSDVVNLGKGMQAHITTDILSGKTFKGNIKLINPRIDEQSGTVKVTVEVYDDSMSLKPGMFVETKIVVRNIPDALVIPRKSIQYKENKPFVYVFKGRPDNAVSKRIIKTGISEGELMEVQEGLSEGEKVVTVGIESLKDGMKVKTDRMAGPR